MRKHSARWRNAELPEFHPAFIGVFSPGDEWRATCKYAVADCNLVILNATRVLHHHTELQP